MKKKILYSLLLLSYIVTLQAQTNPDLILGEFKIEKIIDGDTFRLEGLDSSTRLLAIDTEEAFKDRDALVKTNELRRNWEKFYKTQRGDNRFPVKTDSPMGYESTKWAEKFFKDVDRVRLEYDNLDRTHDMFGRYLVYVIAIYKDGTEVNYNIEAVRQGHSPYFDKYGKSERFHEQFVEAQNYARENNLGIWDHEKNFAYPDYDERLVWWTKRSDQIDSYNERFGNEPYYFNLMNSSEHDRMKDYVGEEIIVFGDIGEVLTRRFPYLLRIPIDRNNSFDLVIFERNQSILDEIDIDYLRQYYIYVKGKLNEYNGRLQIVLNSASQIWME